MILFILVELINKENNQNCHTSRFLLHLIAAAYYWGHCTVHEFHETCHSVTFYFMKKDSKLGCDTKTPESIHTKDESKRGSAFAFIFGVN